LFEEEKEARKTGDALTGEAVMQLQTVLDLEGKQRIATMAKLEEQFRAVLSKLFDQMSELKQGVESRLAQSQQAPCDVGATTEFSGTQDGAR